MPAAILTESVTKIYLKRRSLRDMLAHPLTRADRVPGLRDVSLSVAEGEIFGLLGPNGAGKTTLLKILAGLVLPTSGRALVRQVDVAVDDTTVKRSIGFVTADERSFYWRLTGRENLRFFARLYDLPPDRADDRCDELIAAVDLGSEADRQFMSYSSGMKQRLAIARGLLQDPPILCLDEPTRSLDPIAAKHVRQLVSGRLNRRQGKTILLATHNLQEAEEMCDRLAILDRGRVLRQGTLAEVTAGLPGRDHYLISVDRPGSLPEDPRWAITVEPGAAGPPRLSVAVDRGGAALSDLLRALLDARVGILACSRRDPGLQEIFDLMDGSRDGGGGA